MKILIADHLTESRKALRNRLESAFPRWSIAEADSLDRALAVIEQSPPDLLIITDPICRTRYRTITEICRLDRNIFIMVIGPDDPEFVRDMLSQGALGYLRDIDLDDSLKDAVRTVTGGGVYVPPIARLRPITRSVLTSAGPVKSDFVRLDALERLTPRQLEVLALLRSDWDTEAIAQRFGVAVGTVKIHITGVFKALGVRNRVQAKVAAEHLGIPYVD